jgi:hypothetical protein
MCASLLRVPGVESVEAVAMRFLFFRRRRRAACGPAPQCRWLRVCPACQSRFVVPVDWEDPDERHWWIRLRCGECGHVREVTVADDVAQALDRELHADTAALEQMAAALEREAMERELETLVGALRHDLVDPSDFEG